MTGREPLVVAVITGVVAAGGVGTVARLIANAATGPADRVRTLVVPAPPAARSAVPPWLDRWRSGGTLDRRSGPRHLVVGVALMVVASIATASAVPAVVAFGASLALWGRSHHRRARRSRLAVSQLPDLVEAMGASVRTGAVPLDALRLAAPAAGEVVAADASRVVSRVERGERFSDAMAWWASTSGLREVERLSVTVAVATTFGGPVADALDDLAGQLRDDARAVDELRSHSAQAVASSAMLVALPILSLAIGAVVDPGVVRFLVSTSFGALCLVVGVLLETLGAAWMIAIVRGSR